MANIEGRERLQQLIGDDYRLQWIIGHGGMSTVWLADDTRHDREVALKILRPEFSDNREFLTRFRNEAETAELIDSDNVVRTYDYREIPDPAGHTFCFIAMEYVRGESLADLLAREKSLDEALVLDVLEQAAHGLSIIHRMDLVHRDIKPGNLMITQNGRVKITDFGIAKAAAAVPLTRTGMVVGTAQYVSPEQAQGKEVTSASDVYSLGVVGYEMLAGQRPFVGDSSVSVALAHISQSPPPLSTTISAEARELIGIALRKEPTQRFADGNEMALAVSAVRLGKRPPQPASAAMTRVAQEPTPTESTRMLGQVAHPTTIRPAQTIAPPPRPPAQRPAVQPRRSDGGFAIGVLLAILIAGLLGGGMYLAWQAGMFEGSEPAPTSEQPTTQEIVTEWVTPEPEPEPEPTTEQPPETVTEWITPTPEPEPTPEPAPTPDPVPTEQPTPPDNGGGTPGGVDQILEDLGNLTNGGN
ncbi:serine/threonine-protein kinase [Corynebacterium sp.]|uniref:serine/threonine-protein kinase n=1 Tax=Corynebacterium sp. TaxID=1720 RepID=UPI0026DF23E7|nr:serine/threonine-protein kinase [Corynebacterium sp.]MDO5511714.1 serine/threonine-protein kinase [Corynebacterium sp.]